jgi:hypothetical protein
MPLDPAQRHQIEHDAITAAWEAERLTACGVAIVLLRDIADLDSDDGSVIIDADADCHNDLVARIAVFFAANDRSRNPAMAKLTDTQTIILSAGAQRPENIALPLPKGLAGAAAKMAVTKMIEHGWLQEVDANVRRNEPHWRETGDGHGTTLVVTEAGLLAIGIEPVVVKTRVAKFGVAIAETEVKHPTLRTGTKRALLISMLQRPQGVSKQEIVAATGWQAHSARGAMSGALGKKLGLEVVSAKEDARGRVYRIVQPA